MFDFCFTISRFIVNRKTGVILVAPCENPGSGSCLDFETKPVYYLNYKVRVVHPYASSPHSTLLNFISCLHIILP